MFLFPLIAHMYCTFPPISIIEGYTTKLCWSNSFTVVSTVYQWNVLKSWTLFGYICVFIICSYVLHFCHSFQLLSDIPLNLVEVMFYSCLNCLQMKYIKILDIVFLQTVVHSGYPSFECIFVILHHCNFLQTVKVNNL